MIQILHGVADVGGLGKRRGAMHKCKLTAVSTVQARPGPHDWGSSCQTSPALLPCAGTLRVWVPKSRGPRVPGPHGWGGHSPNTSKQKPIMKSKNWMHIVDSGASWFSMTETTKDHKTTKWEKVFLMQRKEKSISTTKDYCEIQAASGIVRSIKRGEGLHPRTRHLLVMFPLLATGRKPPHRQKANRPSRAAPTLSFLSSQSLCTSSRKRSHGKLCCGNRTSLLRL